MNIYAVLDQIIALLQSRGRVTYNALKLQFDLDDTHLEVLKDELLYSQPQTITTMAEVWCGPVRPWRLRQLGNQRQTQGIRRIMGVVHPLRIVLFGSAARDEMRSDSDLDVLIVLPEGVHRRHTVQNIHEQLFGFAVPVDILVATPEDLRQHKNNIGLVYQRILREGKDIYAI